MRARFPSDQDLRRECAAARFDPVPPHSAGQVELAVRPFERVRHRAAAVRHVLYPGGRRMRERSEAIFDIIDAKSDGFIKLDKLLLGLSALCRGDDEEKLRFADPPL